MDKGLTIALCAVCDDPLDLSDAGVCKTCGKGICWNECGNWHRGQHTCSNCGKVDEVEDELKEDREDDVRG